MTHDELMEVAQETEQTVILFDSLEEALVGYTTNPMRAVYDYEKCVDHFVSSGMTRDEALEWMSYNTERTCDNLGELAPILIHVGGSNESPSNG